MTMAPVPATDVRQSGFDERVTTARRRGTARRRYSIFTELLAVTALYLVLFELLIDRTRQGEVTTLAWLFARFGSRQVTAAANYSLLIASPNHRPILAYVSSSCSSLMGILALGALSFTVLRSRRGHTLLAYACAAGVLFVANIARMAASCLAGLWFGHGALLLFHDWVGTVWNFVATLLGFLLMLYLALPSLERAEQNRVGHHVANRPIQWAQRGLGYSAPVLDRPRPHRATVTGWFVRYLVPRFWKQRLAQRRESRRIDYRVGHLGTEQRVSALRHLAVDGLDKHGATFVAIATHEESPVVIEALVEVILQQDEHAFVDAQTVALLFWARAWRLGSTEYAQSAPTIQTVAQRLVTPRLLAPTRRARVKKWRRAESENPARRIALVRELSEEGLDYNAVPLIAVASSESDPDVLNSLAEAIATRQWEPVVGWGVVTLKLWARAWAMTRRTQVLTTDPGSLSKVVAPEATGERELLTDLSSAAINEHTINHLGSRVVAVTGAGGAAGISVIKALLDAGHEVVAIDADPLAAGLHLSGVSPLVVPLANDPGYGRALVQGLTLQRVDALICTVAEEYAPLVDCAAQLNGLGCKTWLPDATAVETCLDKAAFARCMRQHNVAHPATAATVRGSRTIPGTWIVKPRRGRGSRGVAAVDRPREVRRAMGRDPELIVQSRLVGDEFTADVLVDHDGRLVTCVPRWRLAVSSGISVRGETFDSNAVTSLCAETLAAVGLTGVANVQGFMDSSGGVAVVEVNPRFSGGLPLTLAAGADVVDAYLGGILHPDRPIDPLFFTPGFRMLRYFEEIFEEPRFPHSSEDARDDTNTPLTKRSKPASRLKERTSARATRHTRRHGMPT